MDLGATELRRWARFPSSCRALLHDRYGVWPGVTEDVSPRGCRILTERPLDVGALLRLVLTDERLLAPLQVVGQVAWAGGRRPERAGITFAGAAIGVPGPAPWVQSLEAAAHGRIRPAPEVPIDADICIVIAPPEPEGPSPAALAKRLAHRAVALLRIGRYAAAETILKRSLELAPDAAEIRALLDAACDPG